MLGFIFQHHGSHMGLGWVCLFQKTSHPVGLRSAPASSRHAASSSRGGGVQGLVAVPRWKAPVFRPAANNEGISLRFMVLVCNKTCNYHILSPDKIYKYWIVFFQLMTGTRLDFFGMVASIFDDPPLDQPDPPNARGPRTECSQVEALVVERNLLEEENRCLPWTGQKKPSSDAMGAVKNGGSKQ